MPRPRARILRTVLVGGFLLAVLGGLAGCASFGPGATLRVLAGEATIAGSAAASQDRVDPGDVVEVSGTDALVELQWPDGSFTRLASGTRFEVGADGARGTLESGTAWSTLAPGSRFGIATADGSVHAADGTTFALRCDGECDGVVAEGRVTLDGGLDVAAPASFQVGGTASTAAGWDAIYADPFALANADRDAAAGLRPVAAQWDGRDPALASLNGVFSGPSTPGPRTCTGWAEECARVQANIFDAPPADYAFSISCAGTLPCDTSLEATLHRADGSTRTATFPLTFDGSAYTTSTTFGDGTYCTLPDGSTEGTWTNGGSLIVTPTAAEVRGDAFVVTAVTIESQNSLTEVTPTSDPSCAQFEYEWSSSSTRALALTGAAADAPTALALDDAAGDPRPVSGPARPTVLSGLKSPVDAIPTLDQWLLIGATIVVCVLVLAFPGYLLSRVVSDRFDAAAERRAARRSERRRPGGFVRALSVIAGLTVASLITAALDPSFGAPVVAKLGDPAGLGAASQAFALDLGGWRLVGTAFAAFAVFILLAALVVRIASRRIAPGTRMHLQFRWASLLVLLAGVVVSRVFDLSPGIIFGLVAGLVIVDSLPDAARGRLALVGAVFAIVVGAAAWTGYAVLSPLAAANPDDLVLVTSSEVLSALTIEAVSTLPLALLPFAALDGGVLRRWRLIAWLVAYTLALLLFILVMVAVPGSWVEVQGDAMVWLIGFGAFTVLAIAIWGIHVAVQRRREARVAPEAPME